MEVPFLDLKMQYKEIKGEVEPLILEVMESCSYVEGTYVRNFEKQMEEYLSVRHVGTCSNGTDALVLALKACDVQPGDEVITTPFTFLQQPKLLLQQEQFLFLLILKRMIIPLIQKRLNRQLRAKQKLFYQFIFLGPCVTWTVLWT